MGGNGVLAHQKQAKKTPRWSSDARLQIACLEAHVQEEEKVYHPVDVEESWRSKDGGMNAGSSKRAQIAAMLTGMSYHSTLASGTPIQKA